MVRLSCQQPKLSSLFFQIYAFVSTRYLTRFPRKILDAVRYFVFPSLKQEKYKQYIGEIHILQGKTTINDDFLLF